MEPTLKGRGIKFPLLVGEIICGHMLKPPEYLKNISGEMPCHAMLCKYPFLLKISPTNFRVHHNLACGNYYCGILMVIFGLHFFYVFYLEVFHKEVCSFSLYFLMYSIIYLCYLFMFIKIFHCIP